MSTLTFLCLYHQWNHSCRHMVTTAPIPSDRLPKLLWHHAGNNHLVFCEDSKLLPRNDVSDVQPAAAYSEGQYIVARDILATGMLLHLRIACVVTTIANRPTQKESRGDGSYEKRPDRDDLTGDHRSEINGSEWIQLLGGVIGAIFARLVKATVNSHSSKVSPVTIFAVIKLLNCIHSKY